MQRAMQLAHGVHAEIALFILEARDYLETMEKQLRSLDGLQPSRDELPQSGHNSLKFRNLRHNLRSASSSSRCPSIQLVRPSSSQGPSFQNDARRILPRWALFFCPIFTKNYRRQRTNPHSATGPSLNLPKPDRMADMSCTFFDHFGKSEAHHMRRTHRCYPVGALTD